MRTLSAPKVALSMHRGIGICAMRGTSWRSLGMRYIERPRIGSGRNAAFESHRFIAGKSKARMIAEFYCESCSLHDRVGLRDHCGIYEAAEAIGDRHKQKSSSCHAQFCLRL